MGLSRIAGPVEYSWRPAVDRAERRPFGAADLAIAFACFGVLVTLYSLYYPSLNWPDEAFKLQSLGSSDNPYLWLVNRLSGERCDVLHASQPDFRYGSNAFQVELIDGEACYRRVKLINATLILLLSLAALGVVRRDSISRTRLVLSLLWPSAVFFLTGVNNQVVFHVGSILVVVLAMRSPSRWIWVIAALPLLVFDRSSITLVVFLAMWSVVTIQWRWAVSFVVAFILANRLGLIPFDDAASLLLGVEDLDPFRERADRLADGPLLSLAIFAVSFVYLGGTSAVFGVGLDYLLVGWFAAARVVKKQVEADAIAVLVAFLLTFFLVLEFVPAIQSFRYYVFLLPLILKYLVEPAGRQRPVAVYSVVMGVVYLLQARLMA